MWVALLDRPFMYAIDESNECFSTQVSSGFELFEEPVEICESPCTIKVSTRTFTKFENGVAKQMIRRNERLRG